MGRLLEIYTKGHLNLSWRISRSVSEWMGWGGVWKEYFHRKGQLVQRWLGKDMMKHSEWLFRRIQKWIVKLLAQAKRFGAWFNQMRVWTVILQIAINFQKIWSMEMAWSVFKLSNTILVTVLKIHLVEKRPNQQWKLNVKLSPILADPGSYLWLRN